MFWVQTYANWMFPPHSIQMTGKCGQLSMEPVHTRLGRSWSKLKKDPVSFLVRFRCKFRLKYRPESYLNHVQECARPQGLNPRPHISELGLRTSHAKNTETSKVLSSFLLQSDPTVTQSRTAAAPAWRPPEGGRGRQATEVITHRLESDTWEQAGWCLARAVI